MSDKPYFCGPCLVEKGEIEGVVYCRECEEPLCGQCKQDHARIKVSKHHKLCDLADVPPREIQELLHSLIACPKHETEEVVYLCKDHDMTCCNTCAIRYHRKCQEVKVLSDSVQDIKVDCSGLKTVLHDLQLQADSLLEHERKHEELVSEIESRALSSLQYIKEKLLDMYAQLESDVRSAIADRKKEIADTISTNKEQARNFLNDIKQQSTYIEQVEKFGTNKHVVLLQRQLEKYALCRLKSFIVELKNNKSKSSFKYVEDTSFDSLLMEMKNSVRIEDFTCDASQTGSDTDNSHYKPYTERILQLKSNKDLRIIPMFDKEKYPEPRACIWIDKFIVISLRIVNALLVIEEDSDIITSKFNCDSIPWSVSKTGPTDMVITAPGAGKIAFAQLRYGNVHVVTELKTRIPYCDVTRNYQLNQYICMANRQIDILNNDGMLLREISLGSDIIEFRQTLCTFNACNLMLMLSNCSSDKLMAFNLNGDKVFGYNHEDLLGPGQIAVDLSGNIYVTSIEGSIHQISPSGQFIRSLSLRNEICGLDYPTGICFNRKFDKIAVSCGVFDKPYLQVYTFT